MHVQSERHRHARYQPGRVLQNDGVSRVRRIPVVNEISGCCGIVSQADIARNADKDHIVEVVKQISQPTISASNVVDFRSETSGHLLTACGDKEALGFSFLCGRLKTGWGEPREIVVNGERGKHPTSRPSPASGAGDLQKQDWKRELSS